MAKEELMQFEGLVLEILPDARYRVQLDSGHAIVAYTAGKMKKNRIKTLAGDRVTVEMSPYDLEKGRLVFRHKDERAPRSSSADARAIPPPLIRRGAGRREVRGPHAPNSSTDMARGKGSPSARYRPKMLLKNCAVLLRFFLRSSSVASRTQAICTTLRCPENGRWPCQELSARRKPNTVPITGGTSTA